MFVDRVKIYAEAGDGGNGCVSFRREKFIPKGGPDGGDGGRGGSIILRPDPHVDNLVAQYYKPIVKARKGENGKGSQKQGRAGHDLIVPVPVGTLVYQLPEGFGSMPRAISEDELEDGASEDGTLERPRMKDMLKSLAPIADLNTPGEEFILCKGGDGGKGNMHFKSSTNRVPRKSTPGYEGVRGHFLLELRTIADAGLVGYPNAGKSSLLAALSAAKPKIAPYPFTTLRPNVGVVDVKGYRRLTVADIPGLIEGAHDNIGLGHEFLRHIVRCKVLVYVLDMAGSEGREPLEDFASLRRELKLYDPTLADRPSLIVANKMDLEGADAKLKAFKAKHRKFKILPASAKLKDGIEVVREAIASLVF